MCESGRDIQFRNRMLPEGMTISAVKGSVRKIMKIKGKKQLLIATLALSLATMAGCSDNQNISKTEPETDAVVEEIKTDDSSEITSEEATPDNEEASSEEEVTEESDTLTFSDLPRNFTFTSGAGGWSTDIEINEDGSFAGTYHDSDMGDTGEGYPNGTLYICSFSGKFSDPLPTDKKNVYSMKLLELINDDADKVGTREIADDMMYIYSEPYGFDDADVFLVYLPGASLADMTEECRSWIFLDDSVFKEVPDGYYVLYNAGGEEAFTAEEGDTIWYHSLRYDSGDAYVIFYPSHYMGSSLNFFENEESPVSFSISVPWDGKNTETMICKKEWEEDGDTFNVTVESDESATPDTLKYFITVECVSNPEFDFSLWGSDEPGKLKAVFIEKN